MANCNKLFLDYDSNLNIPKKKKDKLKDSKEVLRERIRKYFKDNHPEYKPEFYIQGSYKMGTTILTKDNECDLDDGVYFRREVDITATTLQKWVKDALDGATNSPVQHRSKCLRVIYQGDYHIDFPVYIFPKDADAPSLAVKNNGFEESDPKEVVLWYEAEKTKNSQLNRLVKYLKGWGDHKRNKMPSGLAMTILATENIQINDRDDVALKDTLVKIEEKLNDNFECIVPATPGDDLFESYEDSRKNNFLNNLSDFIKDAKSALDNEPNQLKASKLWRKHLGQNFPFGEDEDTDAKEAALKAISQNVLAGTAYTQSSGRVSEDTSGVKNKPHTNYGG
ncbi:CBASS cGAMP synthase [Polaribacter aestuariivivens]|uniref:CBASS cGAMP synthase n=1 Tax=Polaribacter aestuariivivens TaxID=2304626 RepID=UPI003F49657F